MTTSAQLDASFNAARAWINQQAGFYASMISDAAVRDLCQVVLNAAAPANTNQTKDPKP